MENNDGTKNELKIELYPDRKPRYNFKKSPLRDIVPEDALETSFDKNKELAFIHENVPMLNGFYTAHCNHYPIRIKPDDIWILIVQAFSHHVNINSESLRSMFVDFSGKKELRINYPLSDLSQVNKKVLENFSEQINTKMKEFLGEELLNILTPNYSTTDYESLIVCKISIMGAFKKYFDYTLGLCGCGVPYLILEGTADDYEKIKSKAKYLSKYKFEWYINKIIPHIDKMIEAKKGKVDVNYFKNMIQNREETEYKPGLSGHGGYSYKVDHLSGWFLNFFAYWTDGYRGRYKEFNEDHLGVKDFDKLPSQMLTVPFKIVDETKGKTYEMKYKVGFIGCDKNKKNEVSVVTGWIVSPSSKEDRESIL
jgi:hypothetical protein